MRGLVWIGAILVLGAGLYLANPPRWLEDEPVVLARSGAKKASQSLVARLAEAGQSMRRQASPPQGSPVASETVVFFDPN